MERWEPHRSVSINGCPCRNISTSGCQDGFLEVSALVGRVIATTVDSEIERVYPRLRNLGHKFIVISHQKLHDKLMVVSTIVYQNRVASVADQWLGWVVLCIEPHL